VVPSVIPVNLISESSAITVSSEDENYPSENIFDRQAARVFRCESKTSLEILIDAITGVYADSIAVINHNFTSSATVNLKAGNSNPPTTVVAAMTWREFDMWKAFPPEARRYYKLEVADSNSEFLQLGQLVIGPRLELPRARRIAQGYSPARERTNLSSETYAGVFWNYFLFDRLKFNPSFRLAGDSELAVMRTLDRAVYGNVFPFVYIPKTDEANVYYVRKDEQFQPSELDRIGEGAVAYDFAMNLTEESRGLEVLE
jgi:hypothetical protein